MEKKYSTPFILMLLIFALANSVAGYWLIPRYTIGQSIDSNCHINGVGQGSCHFTNIGWSPGTICSEVFLKNRADESASSGIICSGRVWPNDTVEKSFSIVVGSMCENRHSDESSTWTDNCSMDVIEH